MLRVRACVQGMDEALGVSVGATQQLDFQFFHRWFNGLFLASAVATIVLLWAQYRTHRCARA